MRPAVPAPISISHSQDVTPSVTPMQPTPLIGNWGDLPCVWEEQRAAAKSLPALHIVHAAAPRPAPHAVAVNGTVAPPSPPPPPPQPATPLTAAPRSGDSIANTAPMPTECIGTIPPPQGMAYRGRHVPQPSIHRPPRGSAVGDVVHAFLPPAPPSRGVLDVLLMHGSSFEAFYSILMRWYDRVVFVIGTNPILQRLPMCPPVSNYVHDFDGWLIQLEIWYTQNVRPQTSKAIRGPAPTPVAVPPTQAYGGQRFHGGVPPNPQPMPDWGAPQYPAEPPYFHSVPSHVALY